MSAAQLQFTLTFEVTYCCDAACATPIVMPTTVYNRFLQNHELFCCPFGHKQRFTGPSEAEKLKQQLESERTSKEWWIKKADQHSKSALAYKGQVTRIKNRVKNGVCPCCNRTFQNLMRHMATKHPDYAQHEPSEKDE